MRKQLRRYLFLMTAGVVLFLPGCEQKTIHNILLDPHRYASQEVLVVGKVKRIAHPAHHGRVGIDHTIGIGLDKVRLEQDFPALDRQVKLLQGLKQHCANVAIIPAATDDGHARRRARERRHQVGAGKAHKSVNSEQ